MKKIQNQTVERSKLNDIFEYYFDEFTIKSFEVISVTV